MPAIESHTPKGIVKLFKMNHILINRKNAIIIGRSNLVGKPLAALLLKENATITLCHFKTTNISSLTKNADIIVVAIGISKFLTFDMIKEGAVVSDVGMNEVDGQLCGDVDYEQLKDHCSCITLLPCGVGPMTIACLPENVLECYKKSSCK